MFFVIFVFIIILNSKLYSIVFFRKTNLDNSAYLVYITHVKTKTEERDKRAKYYNYILSCCVHSTHTSYRNCTIMWTVNWENNNKLLSVITFFLLWAPFGSWVVFVIIVDFEEKDKNKYTCKSWIFMLWIMRDGIATTFNQFWVKSLERWKGNWERVLHIQLGEYIF